MKQVFLFLIFIVCLSTKSQNYIPYHNKCNAACELMSESKYEEAADSIQAAIQLVDYAFAKDLFNLSKCYAHTQQADSCMKYLFMALARQDLKEVFKKSRSEFKNVIDDDLWLSMLQTDYYQQAPIEKWQEEVISELEELKELDQHYRLIFKDSILVWHYEDSLLRAIYRDSIIQNDSITHLALERIIREHGWPGYHNLGNRKSYASLILIHSNEAWFNKMDSILLKEIQLGNLNPNTYASIADRLQMRKKLPPKYNSYSAFKDVVTPEIRKNHRSIGAALPKFRRCR